MIKISFCWARINSKHLSKGSKNRSQKQFVHTMKDILLYFILLCISGFQHMCQCWQCPLAESSPRGAAKSGEPQAVAAMPRLPPQHQPPSRHRSWKRWAKGQLWSGRADRRASSFGHRVEIWRSNSSRKWRIWPSKCSREAGRGVFSGE